MEAIATDAPGWRAEARDFIANGVAAQPDGNRQAATARSIELLRAVHRRCQAAPCANAPSVATAFRGATFTQQSPLSRPSRGGDPLSTVGDIARSSACAAYPIRAVGVRDWTVPPGIQAFDFLPRGGRVHPGMTPVAPSDPRVTGGRAGATYDPNHPASGETLLEVLGFKAATTLTGRLRITLIGGLRPQQEAQAAPFGSQVVVGGRVIEVAHGKPGRWLPVGALADGKPEDVFTPAKLLPGSAPALTFEVSSSGREIEFRFPQGAEIGAILIEPADRPSSFMLDDTARAHGTISDASCLAQRQLVDRAIGALGGRVVQATRISGQLGPDSRPPAVGPLSAQ
ncbi:MAG: hypothetical protein IPK81_04315 [Rhodospirillales bacterium]|nr:MAG: hypothetical protein IPK81_04315 [Rhodospirillales bacterium]